MVVSITAIVALALCCIALSIVLLVQNRSFAKERENYINRIMAKSNGEYITMKRATENTHEPVSKNLSTEEILGDDFKRSMHGVLN